MSIDMSKSGWDNPEGFTPRERDQAPPPVEACEAPGPDGWVCDLKPGHGGDVHRADGGPTWPFLRSGGMVTGPVPVVGERGPEAILTEADWKPWEDATEARAVLRSVREVATAASQSDRPAHWAVALDKILEMTRGY